MTMRMLIDRRWVVIVAAVAVIIGLVAGWQARDLGIALHAEESTDALVRGQTERFYEATAGRVPLADVLGEGFQIMRTDGTRHDRDSYLANPPLIGDYELDRFVATRNGDVLIATFFASLTGTIEGISRVSDAQPRLAVYALQAGEWKLQAFATLGLGAIAEPEVAARKALDRWLGAAASGDAAQVAAVMAPEFQLVRADGSAYGAKEYLAGGMPRITGAPKVESLVATGYGDHLVARYDLIIDSALADGRTMKERAPRMTVFRKSGDAWLVVSHANFATIQ